jgi:ABC-2 type transport system ATP-binding protein
VRGLRAEFGAAIVLTTHYMEEADELCNRVAVLHEGRIRALGTPQELKAQVGAGATLDDVFAAMTGASIDARSNFQHVRSERRGAIEHG